MADEGTYTVTDRRGQRGETRDPRGATATVAFVNPGRPTLPVWNTAAAFKDGFYASALVNRAINILADRIAQLPFRAGADPDSPEDFDKNSPLAKLLGPPPGNPNPESSARMLWKNAIRNYLVAGRFAWEIEQGQGGEVIGLWPLVMGALAVLPTASGRSYFSGFEYNPNGSLQPTQYSREELVYAWNAAPDDPREPYSVLQAIRWNISVVLQLDQYNYAFVKNDAKPASVVVHAPFPDSEARDAWRRQFTSNFKGPLNANRTMFNEVDPADDGSVTGMLDIKQIAATAKDAQLVQIYEQQLDAITTGLGVPMSLMDSSDRTFSNADREMQNFYELTILPLCADLQDHVNRDLAPKLGDDVGWFDLSKVDALKPRLSSGVVFGDVKDDLLRDERRGFAGLGPVDQAALDEEKQANIAMAQAAMPPAPANDNAPPVADNQLPKAVPPPANVIPIKSRLEMIEERVDASRTAAIARLTWMLERQMAELNERSLHSTMTRAEGKRGAQIAERGQDASELFDRRYWHTETVRALAPVFDAALASADTTLAGLLPGHAIEKMDWWTSRRADDVAYNVVQMRWASLRLDGELADVVRSAHETTCLYTTPAELAESAYDDAIRQLGGVDREIVSDLLTRLATGDVDLEAAIGALTA